MAWKPRVTVAAVIERQGQFLLVQEHSSAGVKYNQPAGHLEQDESLIEAVIRETLEETAYHFLPTALLGIYQWVPDNKPDTTYIRVAFIGEVSEPRINQALDDGIIEAAWFNVEEIRALYDQHRSPIVLACIEDYLTGQRYPLALLHYFNEAQS